MKSSELKIGNWILVNNNPIQVTPRFYSGLAGGKSFEEQKKDGYAELNCYHKPIPLTPEILVKCGFEKVRVNIWAIELWDIATHIELIEGAKDCYYLAIDQQQPEGLEQNVSLRYIEHLHQLQNLYFALTGTELEVNL